MLKVPDSGEDHGDLVFICRVNYFFISDGAARLNDGRDAVFRRFVETVTEREESI